MFAIRFITLYKNPSQDYKHSKKEQQTNTLPVFMNEKQVKHSKLQSTLWCTLKVKAVQRLIHKYVNLQRFLWCK